MLARMAKERKLLIHEIRAEHSSKAARRRPSACFDGLRARIHLVRGCKIMLTRNVAYLYGLASGTRGKLVGVVYAAEAPVQSFPEAIVVEVPEYCGPAFYPAQPQWVPLLPSLSMKEGTKLTRTQFPVVAGFAHTVSRVGGLTIKEGVVIHLAGGKRFAHAARCGVPFVAFTRSESFAMTAFKNLPPWSDFRKGGESDRVRQRLDFEAHLQHMHTETLARHSPLKDPEQEAEAHKLWTSSQESRAKCRRVDGWRLSCPGCGGAHH